MSGAVAATAPSITEAAEPRREKILVETEGGRGGVSRDSLRELWQYREVLGAFVLRQVKVKYKQAAIGIGWSVLQPLIAAALFALFLGRFAHIGSDGSPYLLFALTGMTCWSFFSHGVATSMDSVVTDQAMLRKVYFPREILPLASIGAALVDLLPAVVTVLVASALYGIVPTLAWLALPIPLVLVALIALALGVGFSALNVYYRDVRYVLPFLLQLALFATPVVYSLSVVPGRWRGVYAVLNPVAASIDGLRRIVLQGQLPQAGITAGAFAWSLFLLAAGYSVFKRLERGFSDRV
jgi:lipopolysaccharide transport system permease protein